MSTTIEIQNNLKLERLLSSDPSAEQLIHNAVKSVMIQARREMISVARDQMSDDPRGAAKAVLATVYKRIIGGNLNILHKKRAGTHGDVPNSPRGRLARTEQLLGYKDSDRGFVLRFINSGTQSRVTKHMNGRTILRSTKNEKHTYKSGSIGGRGAIATTGFFGREASVILTKYADVLAQEIEKIIIGQIKV